MYAVDKSSDILENILEEASSFTQEFFELRGVSIIIYIDDILVVSETLGKCMTDAQLVIDKLVELGLHIRLEKCSLQPSQTFFFLGFIWDTNRMLCQLPEEKLNNIKALGKMIPSRVQVTVKSLQRMLGCATATRPAVPLARARSRGIQRMVLDHYKDEKSANKIVVLTAWARNDIIWWVNLNECNMSLRSVPVWGSERLATDAMDYAIGSIFRGTEMYEVLDCNKAKQTIAHKEWMAFSRTIRLNLESLKDSIISWHVDNQNVRQAWLNR